MQLIDKDSLSECPLCKQDGCYIRPLNEAGYRSYFCWGCGFNTSDFLKESECDFTEVEISLPELYKDVARTDSEGRRWYPTVINIEEKGTVFLTGTGLRDAQWAGIKTRLLDEQEREKYKNRIKYLSDPKTMKTFGTQFIEACDYVGVFDIKPD
jgi:hypothetical protein